MYPTLFELGMPIYDGGDLSVAVVSWPIDPENVPVSKCVSLTIGCSCFPFTGELNLLDRKVSFLKFLNGAEAEVIGLP
jgi:hypothetical protein